MKITCVILATLFKETVFLSSSSSSSLLLFEHLANVWEDHGFNFCEDSNNVFVSCL